MGVQELTQRIDIVYLWVDGSDLQWQAKRRRTVAEWLARCPGDLAMYGNVAGRYRDNQELRFSLRALERFFPEHGHVYIVTDAQRPAWLRNTPGLTIVDHADLIPAAARPVFDSGHIESYVHRIPGLSERFFYLNDDMFFGAPVDASWWFASQLKVAMEAARAPVHDTLQPDETALVNASTLSAHWLRARYPRYVHDARLFSHAPRPMSRHAMFELESLAPELFEQVRSTALRSWRVPPLVSDLVLRWMTHVGLAEAVTLDPLYLCTGAADAGGQFDALAKHFGRLPFFCINDTCDDAPDDDPRLRRVAAALQTLLPQPSRFEQPVAEERSASRAEASFA
jgi:hypothetical protein